MELHELSKQGKWGKMPELISDELLYTFAIEAPIETLAKEIRHEYGGIADRVMLDDFDNESYWETVVEGLKA